MRKISSLVAGFSLIAVSVFAQDMTLAPNGNVGIGTTVPTSKLDVYTATGDAIVGTSISGWAGYFSGDVNITGSLTVSGSTNINSFNADTLDGLDSTNFSLSAHDHDNAYVNESQSDSITSSMIVDGTIQTSDLSFAIGNSYSLDAADGSPVDSVYVDNDGNVGIGTITPAGKLDVSGNICLSGSCRTTWPAGSGTGAFTDSGSAAYYNGGNVGIGTTNPQGLAGTDNRVLHILHPPTLTGDTVAGIRLEIKNDVDAGIMSAHRSGGDSGLFVGTLSSHRLGLGTNGIEHMTINPGGDIDIIGDMKVGGNLAIGTPSPLQPLHVQGVGYFSGNMGIGVASPDNNLQVSGSNALLSSSTGDFRLHISKNLTVDHSSIVFNDNFSGQAEIGLTGDNDLHFKVSDDGLSFSDAMTINHSTGHIGVGINNPDARLHVLSQNNYPAIYAENTGTWNALEARQFGEGHGIFIRKQGGGGSALVVEQISADNALIVKNATTNLFIVESTGNVGIGTSTPQGKLDVNGPIYQSGGVLHADYVFEPEYRLESIDEHASFMWDNKHLRAIPKAAINDRGEEIVEVGSHRRGIVEELEKAHIYIDQLHEQIKEQQSKLRLLEHRLVKIETEFGH